MWIIYDFIFLIIILVTLPVYLWKRKFHADFGLRLGCLPKDLNLERPIWLHAVSVGETISLKKLIDGLRQEYPQQKFVISTVTATGNKMAKACARQGDFVTYLPLDFSFIVRRVIDKINPKLFIITETEVWPNLISYLHKKNIPIAVVNGKISQQSFDGYKKIRALVSVVLNKISLFCMRTAEDAQRLITLGVTQNKVHVTGNMKFDNTDFGFSEINPQGYRRKLGLADQDKLFISASTHEGEEEIVLGAYQDLKKEFSNLKLLIAIRHPERAKEVARLVSKAGFQPIFISRLTLTTDYSLLPTAVFILDTIGQLMLFYAIADIVFVGGSFVKKGGHNILEPAVLSKPILFGPIMYNFRDIAELFLKKEAAILVANQEELTQKAGYLLRNVLKGQAMAENAREIIIENKGASQRNLEYLKSLN